MPGSDHNTERRDMTAPLTPPGAKRPKKGPDPLLGQIVDERFRLRLVLGEGGMGKVYLAEDTKLNNRRVALKLMGAGLTMDQEFRARFEREAVLQANLPHPQIVQIIDMGECPEGAFIVMEYSEGKSLAHILRELGPLPLDRALEMTEQILEVLDFAHGQSVVHRDLKPGNILIEERPGREVVRLLDFGIAKLLSNDGSESLANTLTRAGYAYGTLGYMAPEQASGETERVDHRADVYAAGIILHEMLTGEVPAPPESRTHPVRYAMWVAENRIQPLSQSHPELQIAEQVDAFLQKALRRDPDKRYQSALAFRTAVKEFRTSATARTMARPLGPTGIDHSIAATHAQRQVGGGLMGWLAAGVMLVATAVSLWMYFGAKEKAAQVEKVASTFSSMGFTDADVGSSAEAVKERFKELKLSKGESDPKLLRDAQAQLSQTKKDIEKLQSDLKAANAEAEEAKKAAESAASQLAANGNPDAALQADLKAKEQALTAAKEQVASLTKERDQLVLSANTASGAEAEELAAAKKAAERLQEDLTATQARLERAKQDVTSADERAARAEAQAAGGTPTQVVQGLRTTIEQLEARENGLKEDNDRLQEMVENERKAADRAAQEAKAQLADREKFKKERDAAEARARKAEQDKQAKDSQIAKLNQDLQTARNRPSTGGGVSQSEYARLRQERDGLQRSLNDAYSRINQLQRAANPVGNNGGSGTRTGNNGGRTGNPTQRPVSGQMIPVVIGNGGRFQVKVTSVTAENGSNRQPIRVPSDPVIMAGNSRQISAPPGTQVIRVEYQEYDGLMRRYKSRKKSAAWTINGVSKTLSIK